MKRADGLREVFMGSLIAICEAVEKVSKSPLYN